MNKAVFLDKDGTLIEDKPYSAGEPVFRPGAVEGCNALHEAGYLLVLVTNQSGIAKGLVNEVAIKGQIDQIGKFIPLVGAYWCPHDGGCECRKPAPGMLLQAANELDIDLSRSWMVGDKPSDIQAGINAGCRTADGNDMLSAAAMILLQSAIDRIERKLDTLIAALAEEGDEPALTLDGQDAGQERNQSQPL